MHERSALGTALTNQFARPGQEASAKGDHTVLNLSVAVLIAALLAALRFPPPVRRRVRSWVPKLMRQDHLTVNLLEEPSFVAFFESLRGVWLGLWPAHLDWPRRLRHPRVRRRRRHVA